MVSYITDMLTALRGTNWAQLDGLIDEVRQVRRAGHTIFVCGNGGSHAVAIHWGVDLPKLGNVKVYTLGTNPALATAIANDLDYQVGLSTELALRARQGDVLVALSCSGRSRNIVAALREAQKIRMPAYLITGIHGPELPAVRTVRIFADDYGILEDCFSAVGHWITRELVT